MAGKVAIISEIQDAGGEALFVRTDVTSEADWERLVRSAASQYGKLDILVNNAGVSGTSVSDPLDTEGWQRIEASSITGTELVIDGGFIAR